MAKGKVKINKEKCKGCELCVEACPTGVLAMSEDYNSMGYHYSHPVNPEKCIGCANCAKVCPDVAIEVYREA